MVKDSKASSIEAQQVPEDLVVMGYISGAFGIQGWVSLVADTQYADSLLDYKTWWVGRDGRWSAKAVLDGHVQPKKLNARLEGVADRDAAFALKGCEVAVPRSAMPALAADEYYWADLVGVQVVNQQGESLGVIDRLFETGANDVIVVKADGVERLVPFVGHVVLNVDLPAKTMLVDWGLDY
ncbi:ribosome maturation factor RimM [uncultured Chitinibacter sp.]|uniref:ribosome maturation factor RimM n=1 Tax=uncultured Chitinibacter sp. TaxID=1214081 RepID=UPI000AE5C678|nr:ribosome maturation factor RimM [uncultured Chitinibacter sp.]